MVRPRTTKTLHVNLFGDSSLHRPLPAGARLPTCPALGRPGPTSAPPQSTRRRTCPPWGRHDGLRRPLGRERRLLQHVLPAAHTLDRAPQLPRQRHRLPRRGRVGDNCLLGTKTMSRRRTVVRRRPARLALLRDPALGRRATALSTTSGPARSVGGGCTPRTGTTLSRWRCSCWCAGSHVLVLTALLVVRRSGLTTAFGAAAFAAFLVVARVQHLGWSVLVERWSPRFRRLQPAVLLHLRALLLVARALLEARRTHLPGALNGTPFKSMLAPARGSDRTTRLRRRSAASPRRPSSPSVTTASSTRAASCRPTPWRTASSSPTASPSAPAAPSAPARSCHYGDHYRRRRPDQDRRLPHEGVGGRPGHVLGRQPGARARRTNQAVHRSRTARTGNSQRAGPGWTCAHALKE